MLSGGEKVRLRLCKILKTSPNLLLLDEPTNHLDIIGKENLEDLLCAYEGTILFVSHDRYFINKVADSLLIFENNEIKYFRGSYQEYLSSKPSMSQLNLVKNNSKAETKSPKAKIKNNNSLVKKVEREIEKLEVRQKEIETTMLDANIYNDYLKMNSLQKELREIETSLQEKLLEWEELLS